MFSLFHNNSFHQPESLLIITLKILYNIDVPFYNYLIFGWISYYYLGLIINDLKETFTNITPENIKKIIIAYEPTWSIGTGIIPSGQEIKDIVNHIKEYYPNNLILYGGSVNDENIETLDKENVVDGYLIGALSLRLDKIQLLINKIEK